MRMQILVFFFIAAMIAMSACTKQQTVAPTTQDQVESSEEEQPAGASEEADGPNPFFAEWDTPFGTPPFDKIEQKHYMPAMMRGLSEHAQEIKKIAENPEPATLENTLEAMDKSGDLLGKVAPVFYGMTGANTNDELQSIARTLQPMMTKHRDDITFNQKLFDRIKAVYDKKDTLGLTVEQSTLLVEYYKDFVRSGAALDEQSKSQLRELNNRLSMLSFNFSENLLKENKNFEMVLDKKEYLDGLPDSAVAAAAAEAKRRGHDGKWVITLDRPSVTPFLQYSSRRDLRERALTAYANRGGNGDAFDNQEHLVEIAGLRVQKAKLLGFDNWAEFTLDRRMAGTPKAVYKLINKVWKPALKVAKKERKALQKMLKKDGYDFNLNASDWRYYAEKLRKEKYDLDDSELRPYFKLENVRDGAFEVARKLYGIKFVERNDIPKYHPDVTTFEVLEEDGTHIGIFYVDYFPRPGKRGGAWSGGFRSQRMLDGKKVTPIVTNVCNFTMPTEGKPSLLSFDEVETLFHEFGHGLHSLFQNVTYARVGDAVRTDFVELPSQIMENWAIEPEVLEFYAKHYETGEVIPKELVEKIKKGSLFNQGFATVEYLAASFLDMDWHMLKEPVDVGAIEFEERSMKKIGMIPEIIVRYRSTNFGHVFSGNFYAAGYYSYMWSEVLDADAFEAFKKNGLFDKATAKSFRDNILSKGGSEDPMVLYKRFRGKEPGTKPLLKRKGML